jgi:hypothetical protein
MSLQKYFRQASLYDYAYVIQLLMFQEIMLNDSKHTEDSKYPEQITL